MSIVAVSEGRLERQRKLYEEENGDEFCPNCGSEFFNFLETDGRGVLIYECLSCDYRVVFDAEEGKIISEENYDEP